MEKTKTGTIHRGPGKISTITTRECGRRGFAKADGWTLRDGLKGKAEGAGSLNGSIWLVKRPASIAFQQHDEDGTKATKLDQ